MNLFKMRFLFFLGILLLESSDVYKNLMKANQNIIDDQEFSFSSIGNEFDFEIDHSTEVNTQTQFIETDLLSESSQNFY